MILLILGIGFVAGTVAAGTMGVAGAGVLTILAAYLLGGMVGVAAGASFLLSRNRDARDDAEQGPSAQNQLA